MVTRRPFCFWSEGEIARIGDVNKPSHQWLSQYLHRPSWATDQGDRSWERELQMIRPHRQWRGGGCRIVSSRNSEKQGEDLHDLYLIGIELGSCNTTC